MTRSELYDLARRVGAAWPHSNTGTDPWLADLWDDVHAFDHAHAVAAVKAMKRDGREHAPNGGQIVAKITELALDLPDWSTVLAQLRRPLTCVSHRAAEHVDSQAPAVRAFAEHVGPAQLKAALDAGAFHGDSTGEAQLREKWLAWARRQVREHAYQGIEGGGLAQLERVNRERPAVNGPRKLSEALPKITGGSA